MLRISSKSSKFCHYSLKSINSNFCEKLTFFWQEFKLVWYVWCTTFATIVRQSKGLFYHFMIFQISYVNIIGFIPKFAHWFLKRYEFRTKNQPNMAFNFENIIILSHFYTVIFDLLIIRHFFVTERMSG